MSEQRKLTLRTVLRLNGGSKYSQSNHEVLADGKPTGIVLIERTNGRPQYRYTSRQLIDGDETLDLMAANRVDPEKWINLRLDARLVPDRANSHPAELS